MRQLNKLHHQWKKQQKADCTKWCDGDQRWGRKRERLRKTTPSIPFRGMERSAKQTKCTLRPQASRRIESQTGHPLEKWQTDATANPENQHLEDRDLQTRGPRTTSQHFPFALLLYILQSKLNPMPVTRRDKGHSECGDLSSKKEKGSTLRRNLVN